LSDYYAGMSAGLIKQYMIQFTQMPQYYPMQVPYGMYEDTDTADTGPVKKTT